MWTLSPMVHHVSDILCSVLGFLGLMQCGATMHGGSRGQSRAWNACATWDCIESIMCTMCACMPCRRRRCSCAKARRRPQTTTRAKQQKHQQRPPPHQQLTQQLPAPAMPMLCMGRQHNPSNMRMVLGVLQVQMFTRSLSGKQRPLWHPLLQQQLLLGRAPNLLPPTAQEQVPLPEVVPEVVRVISLMASMARLLP